MSKKPMKTDIFGVGDVVPKFFSERSAEGENLPWRAEEVGGGSPTPPPIKKMGGGWSGPPLLCQAALGGWLFRENKAFVYLQWP